MQVSVLEQYVVLFPLLRSVGLLGAETCMNCPSSLNLRRSYNAGWRGGPFHKTSKRR